MKHNLNALWLRWTTVNAFAELAGLGATFAVIGLVTPRIDTGQVLGVLLSFMVAVSSGAIEATIVGLGQWWAMHPWFQRVRRFAWWRATLVGALLGYILGYLPSTLMSMGEAAGQAPGPEPPEWLVLLLAAGLGAVAGAVLSFAQSLVLRGQVNRAGLWIPGNMLAWAFGMPIIFLSIDLASKMAAIWKSLLTVGGGLLLAGFVVGVIQGRFLVILAGEHEWITARKPPAR